MTYNIYHPLGGELNILCQPDAFMYEKVCSLEADSLENAFKLGQNDFNDTYAEQGIRSTSVGDIIQSEEDMNAGICHVVCGTGFKEKVCNYADTSLFLL